MTFNEQIYSYSRWPIKHRGESYPDRLSLLNHFIQEDSGVLTERNFGNFFIHSRNYYVRAALEAKFNRPFSPLEIKRIIEDKSWQTVDTPSQTQKNIKEGS